MKMIAKIQSITDHIFKRLILLFEFLLLLRTTLIFLNANRETLAVRRFYVFTDEIVRPFQYIFPDIQWQGGMLDMTTLSAMVGYGIFFFLLYIVILFVFTAIKKLVSNDQKF